MELLGFLVWPWYEYHSQLSSLRWGLLWCEFPSPQAEVVSKSSLLKLYIGGGWPIWTYMATALYQGWPTSLHFFSFLLNLYYDTHTFLYVHLNQATCEPLSNVIIPKHNSCLYEKSNKCHVITYRFDMHIISIRNTLTTCPHHIGLDPTNSYIENCV